MPSPLSPSDLQAALGSADIFLIDQFMRGRIVPGMRVLDAGCGGGRNTLFLLNAGCHVTACDQSAQAVKALRDRYASLVGASGELVRSDVADLAVLPYESSSFDAIVCNAVLHFASSFEQQAAWLGELWRVLQPGGVFFARLATSEGLAGRIESLGGGRYRLPTGQEWLLASIDALKLMADERCGELIDPIKTSLVDGQRSMTTWVMRKQ